jgi:DNA-directed RNA polymerase subunit RPC12/RpoP
MTTNHSLDLTIAQCPKCGANLDVTVNQPVIACEYCGTPLILKYSSQSMLSTVDSSQQGYTLFWDGKQVGHEPNWTREQAVSNLLWNLAQYPERQVEGCFNGERFVLNQALFQFILPKTLSVQPCFIVPQDERRPNADQIQRLMRHMQWACERYAELLGGRNSFKLSERDMLIYDSPYTLPFYRSLSNQANQVAGELLNFTGFNRFTCPYIFFTVMINPREDFPGGCGSPFNGGFNTGGGIVLVSSYALDKIPNFQSTVQHELGHAFGLPHVDAYGYDMKNSPSIMSYNQAHHTRNFNPSRTPGIFIPEDIRGLALNKRVFPNLNFNKNNSTPPGYHLYGEVRIIRRMEINGQPAGIAVRTPSGEAYSSKAANVVQNIIKPSIDTGQVTYDAARMWHSEKSAAHWVSLELLFPFPVELTGIGIHTQHSGKYHAAEAVKISARTNKTEYTVIKELRLRSIDERVPFAFTRAQYWKLDFKTGSSGYVVVRGLQFFSGSEEIFCPLIPCQLGDS